MATEQGWYLGHLSLLDFGDRVQEINPDYVFGCNYAIRKEALWSCGGFHPDAMPQNLIRFRGDGETGLSRKIAESGKKSIYAPQALVYHRVPAERLTVDYFCRRAFNQWVSDPYSRIRRNGGLTGSANITANLTAFAGYVKNGAVTRFSAIACHAGFKYYRRHWIAGRVRDAYRKGFAYHQRETCNDPCLLEYVLQDNYFNGEMC